MELKIQRDVLNDFYSGKIVDVHTKNSGMKITIDMSDYQEDYESPVYQCEFINVKEFTFQVGRKKAVLTLDEIKHNDVQILDTDIDNEALMINYIVGENTSACLIIEAESLRVLNDSNLEVSLLDLAIAGGLCSANSGIDFFLYQDTMKGSPIYSMKYVKFNEELQDYLQKKENYQINGSSGPFQLLIGLDPYGEKIFISEEIPVLIHICEGLVSKYDTSYLYDQKIRYFAEKLIELCKEAISENMKLIAVGD